MIDLVTERHPTLQEEADQNWADDLARQRARALFLRAVRERRRYEQQGRRYRFHAYPRRLLHPSPRDERESLERD